MVRKTDAYCWHTLSARVKRASGSREFDGTSCGTVASKRSFHIVRLLLLDPRRRGVVVPLSSRKFPPNRERTGTHRARSTFSPRRARSISVSPHVPNNNNIYIKRRATRAESSTSRTHTSGSKCVSVCSVPGYPNPRAPGAWVSSQNSDTLDRRARALDRILAKGESRGTRSGLSYRRGPGGCVVVCRTRHRRLEENEGPRASRVCFSFDFARRGFRSIFIS